MTVFPDKDGLKALSDFNIDSQFVQRYGTAIFNQQGEVTEEYKALCQELQKTLTDAVADVDAIRARIPVFSGKSAANQ